jgi:hypothetical protein
MSKTPVIPSVMQHRQNPWILILPVRYMITVASRLKGGGGFSLEAISEASCVFKVSDSGHFLP